MQKKHLYCLILLWLILASSSILFVMNYDFTPTPLPKKTALKSSSYQLYVFLHPYCPCSKATLHELEELLNKIKKSTYSTVKTKIIFFKSGQDTKNWEKGTLWKNVHQLNNVEVIIDSNGGLSKHYQAKTSGETMLFDKKGHRLFDGGITISRGHEGDNPGKEYIYRLVTQEKTNRIDSPVFGCPLFGKTK